MKTKYDYFKIGEELFYNQGDYCIRLRVNLTYPTIEILEDYSVEYYNKTWSNHIIQLPEEIFNKKFNEISELIKSRVYNE